MLSRTSILATLIVAGTLFSAPAFAAGEILITQAKALAGSVTPGDAPGFPVTLSLPGAYQLASNILPTGGVVGIHVAQRNVTIDLNGFELHGRSIANHGIVGNQEGTTIKNGTITGFRFDGISGTGSFWIVRDMRIVRNGRHGVSSGSELHVIESTVALNTGTGIFCGNNCHVEDSIVSRNGAHGVSQQDFTGRGTLLGNTLTNNDGWGAFTFDVGTGNNTAVNNADGSLLNKPLHPNFCVPACP